MSQGKPTTANQQVLEDAKDNVLRRFPYFGQQLFDLLQRDQSRIVYAKSWNSQQAALRVAPSAAISKQFDITLEIPVLIADFTDGHRLEPRTLRQLDTSVELRKSASADRDIAILVSSDARAHDFVKDRKRFAFPVLVLETDRLANGEYANRDLRGELAQLLRSVDHFDYSNEITTAADFFGRVDDIEALTRLAVAGQSVGVFGLRRAGKTSLIYRIRDALRDREIDTIYVQLNGVPDSDAFRGSLLRELEILAQNLGYKRPERDRRAAVTPREWVYGMDELLDVIDRQVVIIIDEIDLANEDAAEYDESEISQRRDLNRVLQQLRGIIQIRNDRSSHKLSFLVAGVAMSVFTQAIRFGRDNQLFGFASARPLKPMSRDEMREMVRTLGKRSGLKFNEHELFDMLFEEYGGHPHLTRKACSVVAETIHGSSQAAVPYPVTTSDLESAFSAPGENSPSSIARQTLNSFARWYPEEAAIVNEVISSGERCRDMNSISHAVDFGLCAQDGLLRIGALARRA